MVARFMPYAKARMAQCYWELIHRMLCQYGFSTAKAGEIVRDAKNEDEYALSLCLLVSKLEPQRGADRDP